MRSSPAPAVCALLLLAANGSAEVIERVLAVVDDTPVLLSETELLQRLKRTDRETALQALIDETLMLREASRLRDASVTPEEEQRALDSLLGGLAADAADLDQDALRRVARRQTVILKYIELRFRPQLRVDDAELLAAYQEQYAGKPDAPPLPAVSKQLLARLTSRALDRRIEAWAAELRAAARIRLNPQPSQP
jgi:hypothetical protein